MNILNNKCKVKLYVSTIFLKYVTYYIILRDCGHPEQRKTSTNRRTTAKTSRLHSATPNNLLRNINPNSYNSKKISIFIYHSAVRKKLRKKQF